VVEKVIEIDRGWNRIQRELKQLKNSYTSIGYMSGMSRKLVERAYINENGAKIRVTKKMRGWWLYNFGVMLKKSILIIPKRPFMKMTFDKNKNLIVSKVAKEYDYILIGVNNTRKSLSRLGEWYTGQMKLTMTNGNFTANSAATVKKKKSSKPLIDSGEMRNSIQHREFLK